MGILFCGAEMEDWIRVEETPGNISQSLAGNFNAPNARCSIQMPLAAVEFGNRIVSAPFSSNEFWVSFSVQFIFTGGAPLKFFTLSGGGTRRIALAQSASGSGQLRFFTWNGSSWDTIQTAGANSVTAALVRYDVYVKLGNPGVFRVYKDGIAVMAETPNLSFGGLANLDTLELCTGFASGGVVTHYTEAIVATWNTIGSKLVTRVPDANGTHLAWPGAAFGNIDEITAGTDYMTSPTANQRASFLLTDFPALSAGFVVDNVRVVTTASTDGGGPSKLNNFVRIGSVDYDQSDKALTLGQAGVVTDFASSPATSLPWTIAELNAAEFGVRSRT
jgi:hypothetical protein